MPSDTTVDAEAPDMQTAGAQLQPQPQPQRSRFTRRNLADMAAAVPTAPLRVIAHIDLDAYYAQCEMLRLGTADDTPLAVQQWRNIIAVNYPARAFGVSRMITAQEARRLCPSLVLQHVPTWKEGETQWAYHAGAAEAMAHHKASLEPYRIRSRAILAAIRDALPAGGRCRLEKAGIDEVFVDLTAHVHDRLVEQYPELLAAVGVDQAAEALPLPPLTEEALQEGLLATGSGVVDGDEAKEKDEGESGEDGPDADAGIDANAPLDWDDVAMLEGARIVHAVREALRTKLRFHCSAGIAGNKLLSKLGSSQHKPDRQTVVRPRAALAFLAGLGSVTQMRGLGGKTGARLVAAFDTKAVAELRTVSLAQLQTKLGGADYAETAHHIYGMLRGVDHSEVRARTEVQSILSAKAFTPPLQAADYDKAVRWLRVFAAELRCRLLDERLSLALLEEVSVQAVATEGSPEKAADAADAKPKEQQEQLTKRLPQRIRLQFAVGGPGSNYRSQKWRSRQTRIPRDGTPLDEQKLFRLGVQLLDAARSDQLWPCAHLAIALDGFEEHARGNQNIASFFQPNAARTTENKDTILSDNNEEEDGGGDSDDNSDAHADDAILGHSMPGPLAKRRRQDDAPATARPPKAASAPDSSSSRRDGMHAFGFLAGSSNTGSRGSPVPERGPHACGRCSRSFASAVQLQEHQDWHVARSLQAQSRISVTTKPGAAAATTTTTTTGSTKRPTALPISSFFATRSASPAAKEGGKENDRNGNNGSAGQKGGGHDSAPAMRPLLVCRRCAASFDGPGAMQIHEDWHLAKDLEGG